MFVLEITFRGRSITALPLQIGDKKRAEFVKIFRGHTRGRSDQMKTSHLGNGG